MDTRLSTLPNQSVVGVYDSLLKAEVALRALHTAGFADDHVSLVKRHLDPDGQTAQNLKLGDDSLRDAAVGSALGGLVGVAGAATLLSFTGFGLILLTGPLVTLTGAIVGGLVGAMKGWGVHDARIKEYQELVEKGKVLVLVAGLPEEIEAAETVLRKTPADNVHVNTKTGDDDPQIDDRIHPAL